jgi:hypothetical protein
MTRSSTIFLLSGFAVGCGPDCVEGERIDGDWRVTSVILTPEQALSGSNIEGHPMEAIPFLANISTWSMVYQGTGGTVDLVVDNIPHKGTLTADPEDCDAFTLEIRSRLAIEDFDSDGDLVSDTTHDFLWTGQLRYSGPRLAGTFSYQDEWTSQIDSEQGSISIGQADFLARPLD